MRFFTFAAIVAATLAHEDEWDCSWCRARKSNDRTSCSAVKSTYTDVQLGETQTCCAGADTIPTDAVGPKSIIDEILDRGHIVGHVATFDKPHYSRKVTASNCTTGIYKHPTDDWYHFGLTAEWNRAVAAALGLGDAGIQWLEYNAGYDGFFKQVDDIIDGSVDFGATYMSYKTERVTRWDIDYAAPMLMDPGVILAAGDKFAEGSTTFADLSGQKVCTIAKGTSCRDALEIKLMNAGITVTAIEPDSFATDLDGYVSRGDCDFIAAESSVIVLSDATRSARQIYTLDGDTGNDVLGLFVRDHQGEMRELLQAIRNAMIVAQKNGLNKANCAVPSANPVIFNLQTKSYGMGTKKHPLRSGWAKDVICAVGNYKEFMDRALTNPSTCVVGYPWEGGANDIFTGGGTAADIPQNMI